MKTQIFQNRLDILIEKTFLWAFPRNFHPNWLTYFRIATVPIIAYLLFLNLIYFALILFVISASTDFIDGAMARRRNKITDLGKVIDPIADKMLIATILVYIGFDYLVVKIFLIFIVIEILAVISGSVLAYKIGRPIGANIYGKVKMVLQSFSAGIFLIGALTANEIFITTSEYILAVALFFASLAGIKVFKLKFPIVKRAFKDLLKNI